MEREREEEESVRRREWVRLAGELSGRRKAVAWITVLGMP
jgi:hypothetical protein